MNKILILSFLYENNICLRQFELLKNHYNKLIDFYKLPISYYGVRATQNGETRIDEDNQIIWLHSNNVNEYDKKLFFKVIDCFKFIKDEDFEVVLKTNTSTLINIFYTNKIIQETNFCKDGLVVGLCLFNCYLGYERYNMHIGNYMTFTKYDIDYILNYDMNEVYENYKKQYYDWSNMYMADDILLSYIITKNNRNFYNYGCLRLSESDDDPIHHEMLINIEDILKVPCVTLKDYNRLKNDYSQEKVDSCSIEIAIMKIFINYIESIYIKDRKIITTGIAF
ncbi:hypothetical protein [uncultured Methanobrevibacter sp.]|uniref:hypothetical protein n=1 Tax=uncultured Methanobrevibacter sp. TaxID=253161 RepID=UPI0025F66801|nr:hypothetical protein [uncultured Methanobrevibacter sp.]